ncbi:IclR family transcriptional regulator [Microvirga pudoricolor]|uniref:IclR family transcriptional regulator n=1 Tax=Microvirga pudoricolor TaxID=2778729 RepID=UPI00194F6E5B|nr:IclR family transcriptional regulator [Microvirga pudoricolor]MBM6593606.1 IclR family transcriptional regulator [Microvirga pudoricolor]
MQTEHTPKSTPAISRGRGIDRVLDLLSFLHTHGRPIRIGDLVKSLNAPRSSTYEIVKTLTDAALLETTSDGKLFFGKALYFYGTDYLREHDLVRKGRDEVDRLALATGETSQFCMLHDNKYTVVHMRAGARPFGISSDIGTQVPLPWTASGRLLLSHLSAAEIRSQVSGNDLALPNGKEIDLEEFVGAVEEARRQGFCITSGLVDAYTHCLAAPVLDEESKAIATLCFVIPVDTSQKRILELRDILVESGRALSLSAPARQANLA